MQPQGRPAQVLRLIPGLSQWSIRAEPERPTSISCGDSGCRPRNRRRNLFADGCRSISQPCPRAGRTPTQFHHSRNHRRRGGSQRRLPAEYGDFATAGAGQLSHAEVAGERRPRPVSPGQFNTQRYLLMPTKETVATLFAVEGYYTDGPFQSDNRYSVRGTCWARRR